MNKRAKKKAEKRRRALAHQILDIVLDINGLEERRVSVSGNKPTASFDFTGNTCGVSACIYDTGYSDGKRTSFHEWGYYDCPGSVGRLLKCLVAKKERMNEGKEGEE